MPDIFPDEHVEDESPWIRAVCRRNQRSTVTGPTSIPRFSTSKWANDLHPFPWSDDFTDDDLSVLRKKFRSTRAYFIQSDTGRQFMNSLLSDLDRAFPALGPKSIDVLCLGLGNPATERASLRQLAVLDLLIEKDARLTRSRTCLYDPVFRSVARQFLRDLGMQILETNEEARCTLSPDRYHFIFLPHCAPLLINNLFSVNWSPEQLQRMTLFSNGWNQMRAEFAAFGEPDSLIATELAYLHALEQVVVVECGSPFPHRSRGEPDFEGLRVQWFPMHALSRLPPEVWSLPACSTSTSGTAPNYSNSIPSLFTKTVTSKGQFYADVISHALVPTFVDFVPCRHKD